MPYRVILRCRRCGSPYHVPRMAKRFSYWFCHHDENGRRCWTFNVWE